MTRALRIGIDVGGTNPSRPIDRWIYIIANPIPTGTNTDAVLLDTTTSTSVESILAWNKKVTTPDITSGIQRATAELLVSASVSVDDIVCVTIGTTVCQPFHRDAAG